MSLTQASSFQVAAIQRRSPIVFVMNEETSDRALLEKSSQSEGWQAESLASLQELLGRTSPAVPHCLVLGLSDGAFSGLEVQRRIARERPEMPIVVISSCDNIPAAVAAIKAGAFDFLVKPCADDALLAVIRQSLQASGAALQQKALLLELRTCFASLSVREKQVMALVVDGSLNKQVGWKLGISEITVKAHRGRVMHKMMARSLADLVRMSAKIEPPFSQSTSDYPMSIEPAPCLERNIRSVASHPQLA